MAQAATASKSTKNEQGGNDSAPDYATLSRQIDTLKSDLSALTEIIGGLGKAEKERLVAAARERGEHLRAAGEAHYDQARQTAENYLRDGERYVREQPGTALGIAAAVGFIVGFLMTSRR